MTSRDSNHGIQQIQQGQKDFRILNSIKSLHKKSLSNPLVTQFDLFSVPVKLNINGHEQYQTFFGGLIHLILIILCVLLTIVIIFPQGLQLNSQITQTKLFIDYGDNGQNIFDHTDQPISFKGVLKQGNSFLRASIKDFAEIHFYQTYPNDKFAELQVSKNCEGDVDFCIKKSSINQNAKIFGSGSDSIQKHTYLQYEIIWCDINNITCPDPMNYQIQVSYSNFQKNKNGKITQYKIRTNLLIRRLQFGSKVSRQIYNSNNYIFGHIANLFHYDTYTYSFTKKSQIIWINQTKMRTNVDYTNRDYVQVCLIPSGQTNLIKQTFDDISQSLLFFLSVKQTFYIIIFFIFVQQYNKNSGYLELADSLYYIDDPSTKKKFNFKNGYQVILVCWLHDHFISTVFNLILTRFGKTINDYLPKKALCAITFIQKAKQLLQQNVFYGTLSNLAMMQSEGPKKVPLQIQQQDDQEDQQKQLEYFKIIYSDNQIIKKQKSIKQQAFRQFCQANNYYCPKRKNQVYKVLTNTKLKYLLAHQMQLQFKGFIKNVMIQMRDNIYQEITDSGHQEIKIEIEPNEESLSHNTSQIFIKK